MRFALKYAFFTLLSCLFVAHVRAQNPIDCATLTAVPQGSGYDANGYLGTTVVKDGNGLTTGATFSAVVTCQAQNGAPITNGNPNPLTIGAIGQDTFPTGCYPGSPSPPPAGGCPSNEDYCEPFFNYTTNNPVPYSSSNINSFTIKATSQTVSVGILTTSCSPSTASTMSTCTPTSCQLQSITVATLGGVPAQIQVGGKLKYTATGNYSDGSTRTLSPTNLTGVPTQWTSQDINIATITSPTNDPTTAPAGVATGTGGGETTVTATNGSISGNALIDVINPPPPPPPPDCSCCSGPLGAKLLETPQQKDVKFRLPQTSCYFDCPCCPAACSIQSPIILDVTGGGFFLTDAAHGVLFNISGTGLIQMGWTASGAANAFLALPGTDGLVHNGQQLFGNFTPQPPSSSPNGFAALAAYDLPANGGNGDGIIDSRDAIFSSLRLWIDANHDGISQPEELHTLPSLGVNSISLTYKWDGRTDQYGNMFRYRAQVNPGDPTSTGRMAYDVFFLSTLTTRNSSVPTAAKCEVPGTKEGLLATGKGLSKK